MKSRQKTLSVQNSGLEVSQNGTPYLRQMTITESFRNKKPKPFKMEEPFVVTKVCHIIDSDSDAETPPQFEFERAPSPPKRPRRMIGVYKPNTSTPKSLSKNSISPVTPNISSSPSPNGLFLKDSPHSVGSNSSSETIRYQYQAGPESIWDEPTVLFQPKDKFRLPNKIDNEEKLIMNYEENAIDAYDIRPNITQSNSVRSTIVRRLDFNNKPDNNNSASKVEIKKKIPKNKTIDADNHKNNNTKKSTDINIPKRTRKRKNCAEFDVNGQKVQSIIKEKKVPKKKTITADNHKNNNSKNSTDINIPKKTRKSKNSAKSDVNRQKSIIKDIFYPEQNLHNTGEKINTGRKVDSNSKIINNTVKENSSPEQSLTKTNGNVVIKDIRSITLTPLQRSSLKLPEHLPTGIMSACALSQIPSKDVPLSAEENRDLPAITIELIKKGPPNHANIDVAKKKDNLTGIIDKLHTSQLTTNFVSKEIRNNSQVKQAARTPQRPSNVVAASARVFSPTGWIGKTTIASNSSISSESRLLGKKGPKYKAQNVTPNKTNKNNTLSQSTSKDSQNNSMIQPSNGTLDKSQVELEKNSLDNSTQIKQSTSSPDDLTSIRSRGKTTVEASTKVIAEASASTSTNNCSTPEKQKMSPNTPVKNSGLKRRLFRSASTGSPKKRGSGSPNKGSPVKNREIKSIKSKEGKQLQVRQMDELIKLFDMAATNRHLRTVLNGREREILDKFRRMEDNKQYFLMKLFVWKRLWYNIFSFCSKAKIVYDDEKDITDIFEYLREEELVDTDYKTSCNLFELLNRLDLRKVKEIMEERRIKPIRSKEENIKTILAAANRQATLTSKSFKDLILESIEKKMGFAIKLKEDVFNIFYHAYLLATFTNPNFYKIEDYFNNIIHLQVVFPETPVEDYPVFYSREKFLSYGRALKMRAGMEEHFANKNRECKYMGLLNAAVDAYEQLYLDTEDTQDHLDAPHLKRFTAQHVYTGILSFCCENMFTKNGHPKEVKKWLEYLIKKFPNSRRLGKWYELLIKIHMRHLENVSFESAAKVLIEALGTKKHLLGDIAIYDLGELGNQLKSNKRHKIDQIYHDRITQIIPRAIDTGSFPQEQIDSRCIRSDESGRKRMYIAKSNEGMAVNSVEEVALKHYAQNGYPEGEHVEGSPIRALLMLFFWDIIYNPAKVIPGAFLSKLQTAPLDMFTCYFYANRRELIEERLGEIDSGWSESELFSFASSNWQKHSHERSAFGVIIDVIKDKPRVEVLISVIGRKVLAKIFKRILKHSREFRSGMPDLLVWNVDTKKSKFVEVKGEGDKLSTNQKLWLQYLQQSGASIEVCNVHSTGSKKKKIKKVQLDEEPGLDKPGPSSRPDD